MRDSLVRGAPAVVRFCKFALELAALPLTSASGPSATSRDRPRMAAFGPEAEAPVIRPRKFTAWDARTLHITPVVVARMRSRRPALVGALCVHSLQNARCVRSGHQTDWPAQGVVDAPLRRRLDAIAERCPQLERTLGFPKNQFALCARESRRSGYRRAASRSRIPRRHEESSWFWWRNTRDASRGGRLKIWSAIS